MRILFRLSSHFTHCMLPLRRSSGSICQCNAKCINGGSVQIQFKPVWIQYVLCVYIGCSLFAFLIKFISSACWITLATIIQKPKIKYNLATKQVEPFQTVQYNFVFYVLSDVWKLMKWISSRICRYTHVLDNITK